MRVLSIVHEPTSTGGGGLFEDAVDQRGDRLERWVTVEHGDGPANVPERYDAILVFGGAMHPDQDGEHPWLADEADFIRGAIEQEVPLFANRQVAGSRPRHNYDAFDVALNGSA